MADQVVKTYNGMKGRLAVHRIESPMPGNANETTISYTITIDGAVKPLSTTEAREAIGTLERALAGT